MKALVGCACAILVTTAITAAGAAAKPAGGAMCPLKPGSPSGGDVQWAFTETGPPSGQHHGIRSSYTHGRGNWTSGHATGKACGQDSPTTGSPRNLVLAVTAKKSKLSPRVTQFGLLGVRLVVPVRISASDDSTCAVGTRGTATLFASYFSVHRDGVSFHFAAPCASHNHSFSGSNLHVYIARHGAQVNSP